MAGSARLVLVDGAVLLHPEAGMFEAILAGWRLQQESRLLAAPTVDSRDKTLRRFQEFTGEYPWRWGSGRHRGVVGVVAFGGPVADDDPGLSERGGDVL